MPGRALRTQAQFGQQTHWLLAALQPVDLTVRSSFRCLFAFPFVVCVFADTHCQCSHGKWAAILEELVIGF